MNARPIGERLTSMPRSAVREFMGLAAKRPGTIRLELGEPDFVTPKHIIDAALAAAHAGFTKYAPTAGFLPLRRLIADRIRKRTGAPVEAENVVVTTGAVGGIFSVLTALIDAGDEVLLPDPVWPNYRSIVHVTGGRVVNFTLHPESGFLPDPKEMAAKITSRTKLMVLNTPCNPTGTILPGEVLSAIGEIANQTGVWVVSDEIYEDIVFEREHASLLGRGPADRTVIISGFSKTYAMTGWRLGWVVCPPALASLLSALQEPLTSGASAISQKAGEAALTGPQDCVEAFREAFRKRRDVVLEVVGDLLAARPAGSFYALVNVRRKTPNSLEFAKELLATQGVAVVPAGAFGSTTEGHVRVAFTLPEPELREGLSRLRKHVLTGR